MVDVLNPLATKVVKFLIENPSFTGTQKELSANLGIPESRLSTIIRFLVYRKLMEVEGKRIVARTRELINFYSMMRAPRLFPAMQLSTDLNPRQLFEFFAKTNVLIVHCLFTASNEYAFYESPGKDFFYVKRDDHNRLKHLYRSGELHGSSPSGDALPGKRRAAHVYEVFIDNFEILSTENGRNGLQTDRLQTYIDLYNFPGGAAAAEYLLNVTKFLSPDYQGLSEIER